MNDNIPTIELPEVATNQERLVCVVDFAREAVSLRVGYEVELAAVLPVHRDGHANLRVIWRRKPPILYVVS